MYLYKCTILAKPNSLSSDFTQREMYEEFYHPDQLTYREVEHYLINYLNICQSGLACIISIMYTTESCPDMGLNKENNNV